MGVEPGHQFPEFFNGRSWRCALPGWSPAPRRRSRTGEVEAHRRLRFDHEAAVASRERTRHAEGGIARQGSQPVHFGCDMLEGVTALRQGDAQDPPFARACVHPEDAVHIVGDQSQTGYVQVIVPERIQSQRAQAAGLSVFGEGSVGFHWFLSLKILMHERNQPGEHLLHGGLSPGIGVAPAAQMKVLRIARAGNERTERLDGQLAIRL